MLGVDEFWTLVALIGVGLAYSHAVFLTLHLPHGGPSSLHLMCAVLQAVQPRLLF
jgi:hypothetical protein